MQTTVLKKEKYKNNINDYYCEVYQRLADIPLKYLHHKYWANNEYFSPKFIDVFSQNNKDVGFTVIFIVQNGKPVAVTVAQLIDVKLNGEINFESKCCVSNEIFSRLAAYKSKHPDTIMLCGSFYLSGENCFNFVSSQDRQSLVKEFVKIVENIAARGVHGETPKIVLFKDFSQDDDMYSEIFEDNGYGILKTEPAMLLSIKPEWIDFEAYLAALKTKYRTKAKKALKESTSLHVHDFSSSEIIDFSPQIEQLYDNVERNASFSLGKLNIRTYADLKKSYPNKFIFRTYWLENEIVGFMTAFKNKMTLDAHYVGLDYEFNKKYYIYQRMLYDYIRIAIQEKLQKVNFGRTASEIKSTVGAVPVDLVCYIKHRHTVQNSFLRPIANRIKPIEAKIVSPFKKANNE